MAHAGEWNDTPEHKLETVIDGIGVASVVGILSKGDELLALIKHNDVVFELRTMGKLDNLVNVEEIIKEAAQQVGKNDEEVEEFVEEALEDARKKVDAGGGRLSRILF